MPPLRKLRIGALNDLARQLRFAPPETLRRQLERAEELAAEVDPTLNYPEDWVIFRVTGYRQQIDSPAIVVGEALLGDMSALIERLSASARISESELEAGKYLSTMELEERWGVSRKTIDRYRLRGLIARRVSSTTNAAHSRLAFPVAAVERFEQLHASRIKEAASFSRIPPELETKIIRRAALYHHRCGCSLNQAAKRLSDRHGRALETVRQLLRRHEATQPIFAEPGPPSARERRLIERAWWWGIEPGRIATHLNRNSAAIQRIIIDSRAARLSSLTLATLSPRAADSAKALASEACTRNLGSPSPTDLQEWLAAARSTNPPAIAIERARAIGYHALTSRAAKAIATLERHGNASTLVDQIETDLRWAARLKAELVRSELPLVIRTLEDALARPLEEVRAHLLIPLITASISALADAADSFDVSKGGRLAAPAGLAITRIATRYLKDHIDPVSTRVRASPRLGPGTFLPDWTRRIAPWQSLDGNLWLEPHHSIRAGLFILDDRQRRLLELRYGWNGPPRTINDAAKDIGLPPVRAAAMERRALNRAATAARLESRP